MLKPVNSFNQHVPVTIAEILHQALALNANVRPQTALKMRSAFNTAALETASSRIEVPVPNGAFIRNADQSIDKTALKIETTFTRKPKISSEQLDKQFIKSRFDDKTHFRLSIATTAKIATAILLMCGIAYAILNYRLANLAVNNPKLVPVEKAAAKMINDEKQIAPNNTSQSLIASPNVQTNASQEKLENQLITSKAIAVQPVTVLNESAKNHRLKSAPSIRALNKQKAENSVAIKQESKEVSDQKPEKLETNNRKSNGFKGFLNKIGSGAMRLPKTIFKKKKD